ncbi:MAG: LutB/LldF family L-lactate oxidation iron-sulfur protein [Cyclobacteriaceae bacterium]
MHNRQKTFLKDSKVKTADLVHRKKINFTLRQSEDAFKNGKKQFSDLESVRKKAKNIKWEAIEHLDKYLEMFEANFIKNGGKVIWAENTHQALDAILKICQGKQAKTIVKSKSMVTEEIHLNDFLTRHDIEIVETDLGEYIQQLDGEPPYHIVSPAMHKSKEDVAHLFHEKLKVSPNLTPEQLTLVTRQKLRQKFRDAEIGITGANFILADIGGIAITENEGNAWLSGSFPKTHIAITGIEKVLPSVHDLGLFWPLLATHGSGQHITVYNSIFTGPKKENETDGPEEMYMILLDNGRTNILADKTSRESLYCIRCGACLNVCPVYQNIGGHTYKATYSGPIGSVITPYLNGIDEYKHLSHASSLCGSCTEVCPVRINLHELLLHNRRKAVTGKYTSRSEQLAWYAWKKASMNRQIMDGVGGDTKNFVFQKIFKRAWGADRTLPVFSPKSFNQLWKERKN